MADNDNKNNGIKIDISYKYDSSGLKRAVADIEKVDTQTERGILQTKKNIDALVSASKSMAQYLTKDNAQVAASLERQQKAYEAVTRAQNAYKTAQSRIKTARQSLKAVKESVLGDGRAIKQGKVFSADGVVDEQRTSRLVSANEALKRARLSQNNALITLQSNEKKYKQALLETAAAQKQIALDKTKSRIDAVSNAVKRLSSKIKQIDIQRLVAQIFMLRRAWQTITAFVTASADWVENLNLLEVVFGESADAAKEFVKATANNLGLDVNELAQYASTFKQMANAMGQAAETGTQMSKALTYLALDISSLRNVDIKTAMSDLASGIAGQVKPVRKYGADITEDSINAFLRPYGMSTRNLSQADKQLVRSLLLIRQLKDAWGDMAKTIDTFSNQQRVLNAQFENFKRLIGSVLVGTFKFTDEFGNKTTFEEASKTAGIATKAIWYLNGALMAVNEILQQLAPDVENVNGAIKASADDITDSFGEIENATKGSLASFDKFNTLSGGSGAKTGISALLEKLFGKESSAYIAQFEEAMKNSSMYAKQIANTFLEKFFPDFKEWKKSNPDGLFADWAKETGSVSDKMGDLKQNIYGLITLLVGIKSPLAAIALAVGKTALGDTEQMDKIAGVIANISSTMSDLLPKIADIAVKLAPIALEILEIVVNTLDWITKNDLLLPLIGLIISSLITFKGIQFAVHLAELAEKSTMLAGVLSKLKNGIVAVNTPFAKFAQTNAGLLTAISALGIGITIFVSNLDKLSSTAKVVIPIVAALAAVIAGAAVATAAWSAGPAAALKAGLTAAAIAGGVTLAAGTVIALAAEKHADGGFQTGGLFYAGEKGAEWVGRQGSTSTIVNDTQMSDIMRDSVAQGVKSGMASAYGDISRAGSGSGEAAVYLDGNKVGRYVAASAGFRGEANRRNTGLNWR